MAQVRGSFVELYDNIDKEFYAVMKDRLKELPKIYPNVFNIKTSDRKFERIVTYVPMGDTQPKPEGEAFATSQIASAYTKDFTHTENGLAFEVTTEVVGTVAATLIVNVCVASLP